MGPPILQLIKLLFDPSVSKKMIIQLAYKQISAIGFAKILSILLSAAIVGVSSVIKIPQIKKIINPKLLEQRVERAEGLSLGGLSLETFNYLIHVTYNRQNENPFLGYGEALLLGIQNSVIISLIQYYKARNKLSVTSLEEQQQIKESLHAVIKPLVWILVGVVFFGKVVPKKVVNGLQVLNIPLSIISKLPQIKKNSQLQSTSHLSNITVGANVLGSLSRVFTTVQNFDKLGRDYILLAGYTSSLILNSTLAGQCYYYGKKQQEEELERKKLE